jgi:hypothetical protein
MRLKQEKVFCASRYVTTFLQNTNICKINFITSKMQEWTNYHKVQIAVNWVVTPEERGASTNNGWVINTGCKNGGQVNPPPPGGGRRWGPVRGDTKDEQKGDPFQDHSYSMPT